MGQHLKSPGGKHPVFSLQRHHIRHGAKTHHVGVFLQYRLLISAERGGQLEGHTHTGQVLVGISAVRTVGVHHCGGLG